MPIIWARNPAFNRISQVNPNGPTLLKPTRWPIGGSRPPEYVLEERFDANNELVFRDDFNAGNVEVFRDDFNRADIAPWVDTSTAPATLSIVGGELTGTANGNTARGTYDAGTVDTSKWYSVTATNTGALTVNFFGGNASLGNNYFNTTIPAGQTETVFFAPTSPALFVNFSGGDWQVDNVLIEEVPALDGWEPGGAGADALLSVANAKMKVTNNGAIQGWAYTRIDQLVEQGAHYLFSGLIVDFNARLGAGTGEAATDYVNLTATTTNEKLSGTYFQAGTALFISAITNSSLDGEEREYDNIQLERIRALEGWEPRNGSLLSIVDGQMRVENGDTQEGAAVISFTTEIGAHYVIRGQKPGGTNNGRVWVGTAPNLNDNVNQAGISGDFVFSFTATAATTWVTLRTQSSVVGNDTTWDDITVEPSLIENPTFDSDVSGWTPQGGASPPVWVAGEMEVTGPPGSSVYQVVTGLEDGQRYTITANMRRGTADGVSLLLQNASTQAKGTSSTVLEEVSIEFQAASDTLNVLFFIGGGTTGTAYVDWVIMPAGANI